MACNRCYHVNSLKEGFMYYKNSAKHEIDKIFKLTEPLCKDYPKHKEWFYKKHIPEVECPYIKTDSREVLYINNPYDSYEIIGIACLKKTETEKKICCLYVDESWRNEGIGTLLFEESFKWLGTTRPLFTFPEYKIDIFKPIINKYGWNLIETLPDVYGNGHNELCFNGKLVKDPEPKHEQITIDHILKLTNN